MRNSSWSLPYVVILSSLTDTFWEWIQTRQTQPSALLYTKNDHWMYTFPHGVNTHLCPHAHQYVQCTGLKACHSTLFALTFNYLRLIEWDVKSDIIITFRITMLGLLSGYLTRGMGSCGMRWTHHCWNNLWKSSHCHFGWFWAKKSW